MIFINAATRCCCGILCAMKNFFSFLFLLLPFLSLKAANISSTTTGGLWSQSTTWVGGVIPGANDDVTIAGAVSVSGSSLQCRSLTVNSGGLLQNQASYSSRLEVLLGLTNNGQISNNSSGILTLLVNGDVVNNGLWKNYSVEFRQTSSWTLQQGSSGKFTGINFYINVTDSIVLGSRVRIDSSYISGNSGQMRHWFAGSQELLLNSCELSNLKITGTNLIDLDKSLIYDIHIDGNAKIDGDISVSSNVTLFGNPILKGRMRNQNAYSRTLILKDSLQLDGTIENNSSGILLVELQGDLHLNGIYRPYSTTLSGARLHALSAAIGKSFEGSWYLPTADSVDLKSSLHFKKVLLDGTGSGFSVIRTSGNTLFLDSCRVFDLLIRGGDSLSLQGTLLENNVTLTGNARLSGEYFVGYNVRFDGEITHYGVMKNHLSYSRSLEVYKQLNNHGYILNNTSGILNINLHGNLYNAGKYFPNQTSVESGGLHALSALASSDFEGSWFIGGNDSIQLLSDVKFRKCYMDGTGAKASVFISAGKNMVFDTCNLYDLVIRGDDSLTLEGSSLQNNIALIGNVRLNGDFQVGTNVYGDGHIVLYGTMRNLNSYSRTFVSKQHLDNRGRIINSPSGNFGIEIQGSLHNAGTYSPLYTSFSNNQKYTLSQSTGTFFTNEYYISDTNSVVQLASDVHFKQAKFVSSSTPFPYPVLQTDHYSITLDTSSVSRMRIISHDTIQNGQSTYYATTVAGLPVLSGEMITDHYVVLKDTVTNIGIIRQLPSYAIEITSEGLLKNYGSIKSSPSGVISVKLIGSLQNEGEYYPYYTTFTGPNTHSLMSTNRSPFKGDFYIDAAKGTLEAGSDLIFHKSFINLENNGLSVLNGNGYSLIFDSTYLSRCQLYTGDSLILRGTTTVYKVDVKNSTKLYGTLTCQSEVNIYDTLFNYGIIQNDAYYSRNITVYGPLHNYGELNIHPLGGSFDIVSYSDFHTKGPIKVGQIQFRGSSSRNLQIFPYQSISGNYYVVDTLILKGDNILPNIQPYNSLRGLLQVDSGASLHCDGFNYSEIHRVKNKGRILVNKSMDNTRSIRYDFANAQAYNYSGSDIENLLIESYGHQHHPATEAGVAMWWRLKPRPTGASDSLSNLYLYYDSDLLNGIPEGTLELYFSDNAGIKWKKLNHAVTRDTINNRMILSNAPAYGHYLISGTEVGLVKYDPMIERAEPRVFGNKGTVTLYGFGLGLKSDMIVRLEKNGQTPVTADTSYLTDARGESFLAVFDASQLSEGKYSLLLDIPGHGVLKLENYFTVETAERPEPWAVLSGRDRFLIGRWQTFNIHFGNKANTDAGMVPLFFVVNDIPGMEVEFPDIQIGVQSAWVNEGWTQWKDTSIDLYYLSDTFGGYEGTMMRIYPFIIPRIGANSAQSVRVRIKVPGSASLQMGAWITDPLMEGLQKQFKEGTPPEVALCIAGVAAKYAWDKAIGFVPGYDCYKLAYKVGEAGVAEIMKDPNEPEKPNTMYSMINSFWGWGWSIVECAGDIIPVTKGIKVAKELIDIGFDMKNNFDADRECREKFKAKSKSRLNSRGVTSFDPNEMVGPQGFAAGKYISDATHMAYTVYFENKDTAQAAAVEVLILDTLDKNLFDFNTFSFQHVTIADSSYEIEGFAKEFRILVDLSPRIETLVQITGSLDTVNGLITVRYLSLDRSSLEDQEDVDLGFLPPNKTAPQGEGNFSYSLSLKQGLPHNTLISNKALIFFDANAPIETNIFTNRIDKQAPQSSVSALPAITRDTLFDVQWTGSDDGAGIEYYSIYVSENDSDYISWTGRSDELSASFQGKNGQRYRFYSVATDSLGISEIHPAVADAFTEIILLQNTREISRNAHLISMFPNPVTDEIQIVLEASSKSGTMELFDMQGRLLLTQKLQPGKNTIHVSQLPRQMYVIRCRGSEFNTSQLLIFK